MSRPFTVRLRLLGNDSPTGPLQQIAADYLAGARKLFCLIWLLLNATCSPIISLPVRRRVRMYVTLIYYAFQPSETRYSYSGRLSSVEPRGVL